MQLILGNSETGWLIFLAFCLDIWTVYTPLDLENHQFWELERQKVAKMVVVEANWRLLRDQDGDCCM